MTSLLVISDEDTKLWNPYCVKSVNQFCDDLDSVVVVEQEKKTKNIARTYLHRAYLALHADQFTDDEYIGIMYSNFMFHKNFSINQLFKDGRPIVLCDSYSTLAKNEGSIYQAVLHWQHSTKLNLGWDCRYEFARSLPIVYPRSVFAELREHLLERSQCDDMVDYFNTIANNKVPAEYVFCPFNVIGSYLFEKRNDDVEWIVMSRSFSLHNTLPPISGFFGSVLDDSDVDDLIQEKVDDKNLPVSVRKYFKSFLKNG